MSWSVKLKDALANPPYQWTYLLRTVAVGSAPGGHYIGSSLPGSGYAVIGRNVRINGASLKYGRWSSTLGSFTVELVGSIQILKRSLTRGTFVELLIGRPDWPDSDYQTIAIGQVQQLSGRSPLLSTLTCRDLLSALRCRPSTTAANLALGYRLDGASATLAHAYAVGDPTMDVNSTTGFELGSGSGAILVTPASGDDPFILRYSGTAHGTELTGISVAAVHNTVAMAADVGTLIHALYWIEDHPLRAFRRVLLSVQGTDTNAFDSLPAGDGLALPYEFVDHQDCEAYYVASDPTLEFEIMSAEQVDNPIQWVQSWMAAGGFYLTIRQGRITGRAAVLSNSVDVYDQGTITDDDIEINGVTWEAWDSDTPEEYCTTVVTSNNADSTSAGIEDPATLPATYRKDYDVTSLLYSLETDGRTGIINRVFEAHQRVPERYTLQLRGLRWAGLAPGDFVRVTSRQIAGRMVATYDGLNETRAIVTQVSADFGKGSVSLVVLVFPLTDVQFP